MRGTVAAWWLALVAGAAIGLALWLRTTAVPYLALGSIATVAVVVAARLGRARRWGVLGALILFVGYFIAGIYQRRLSLVDQQWTRVAAEVGASGVSRLREAVDRETRALQELATAALRAPADPAPAFASVDAALGRNAPRHRGVVLFRDTSPLAWAGDIRAPIEEAPDSIGLLLTPFYAALTVSERAGIRRAVATSLLHAQPPADRLARALGDDITQDAELTDFQYRRAPPDDSGWTALHLGDQLVFARPVLLSQGEARVRLVERARLSTAIALAVALLLCLYTSWVRPTTLARRFAALGVALVVTALVPFNAFSNVSRLFDPAVYFASLGGPLTGSVAALAVTGAIFVLGCFALSRSPVRPRGRWLSLLIVLVVAALGPFLLRELSRGITLPPRGAPPALWLGWEIGLFLAASATLLLGVGAGRLALGTTRGLSPALAPVLAAASATISVVLWQAPGRWPGWYAGLWVAVMVALAFARRSRAFLFSAGVVAACGAVTLTWGAVSRKRVELAQTDVAQLSSGDPSSADLLERFASTLDSGPPPMEREDLLVRYVSSPLAAAGHPVSLASWAPGEDHPHAELLIADFDRQLEAERTLVHDARVADRVQERTARSPSGVQTLVAVPHGNGAVTTVVVAPRTRLIPEDPFTSLIGLASRPTTEPPYDVTLTTLPSPLPLSTRPRWIRKLDELHGDWLVPGAADSARVHAEVELRGLDVLLPRGALLLLLDLLILSALWTLTVAADGALWRWGRSRVRRWARSYRGRLTVTLFGFFVIPAGLFAVWSYRRLQTTDRESRVLLIQETLRAVSTSPGLERLDDLSDRFEVPLLEYRGFTLRDASDRLFQSLAPVGRFLPRDVAVNLGVESEVTAFSRPRVGGTPVLFGYRTIARRDGERAVIAAPARAGERALDRERRDITILVLFVTSLGALAALWLSGVAARELERPVGALRRAALRIARGERYPGPDERPAEEFVPVFTAFERMDADLASSRAALQEARRRTEAVLRDVASGVAATDRDGRVTIANPGAEEILGKSITPGVTLAQLGAPSLHDRTVRFLAGTDETETFQLDLGQRQLRGSLTRLTEGLGGAVLTLDDVTELARAQRVLAWGEMARQVAHEIKNPLTPIRLGVQHLQRARHDARVDFDRVLEQNVSRILAEIDRLDEIARAFSRYGLAPAERQTAERVDVAAVVRDVVELEQMGVSDVRWEVTASEEVTPALARAGELRDVLLNLLENARQARARHVTVAVERRNSLVDIVITDDGDGIPPEHLPHVFEPHFSTRTSGSGLGLAISRGLVTSWGGEMRVTSEPGRRTELRITLKAGD